MFKFQTKKQLREENARLKAMLFTPKQIHEVERDVQKIQSSFSVSRYEDVPVDFIKDRIASDMAEYIKPIIEFDFKDDGHGGKAYTGSIFITNKK